MLEDRKKFTSKFLKSLMSLKCFGYFLPVLCINIKIKMHTFPIAASNSLD